MKKFKFLHLIYAGLIGCLVWGCSKDNNNNSKPSDIWDINKDGIPKFVETNFIDLSKIYRISKYRSSVGHDYSDAFEQCRSMKHYFEPLAGVDWASLEIRAPVSGIITRLEPEWAGTKIEIASDQYPAFRFQIFHINLARPYKIEDKVVSGELLGTHIGSQTYTDISVIVNDPTRQGRFVSYIEVLTEAAFDTFSNFGVKDRSELIISKSLRDANPLTCNGDVFTSFDPLDGWFILK